MYLLDTNVLSEMVRAKPSPTVLSWLDQQEIIDLFVSTVTLAEIYYALSLLPTGQRRQKLERQFTEIIEFAPITRHHSLTESSSPGPSTPSQNGQKKAWWLSPRPRPGEFVLFSLVV